MTMAHIRVLKIVKAGKGKSEMGEMLPGSYKTHREFLDTNPPAGEYVFLEAHSITGKKDDDAKQNEE